MARGAGVLPGYLGHVDAIEPALAGWVAEAARPGTPVAFVVCIDGAAPLPLVADRPRPDVAAAGLAAANCGFSIALPAGLRDGAEHAVALVLRDGRRLDLPGLPPAVVLGPVAADVIAAGAAGLEAVLDLLRRTDGEAGFDAGRVGLRNAAAFNAVRPPDEGFLFYARAGARLVGYGRLDRAAAGIAVLALTVLAAYRRKGLGEALLRAVIAAAAAEPGLREIWLSVRPDNLPALHLYEKLGFARAACPLPRAWAVPGELTMMRPARAVADRG
jgi:ribosomal protein S18 acetylase RimI-like enzyme